MFEELEKSQTRLKFFASFQDILLMEKKNLEKMLEDEGLICDPVMLSLLNLYVDFFKAV